MQIQFVFTTRKQWSCILTLVTLTYAFLQKGAKNGDFLLINQTLTITVIVLVPHLCNNSKGTTETSYLKINF